MDPVIQGALIALGATIIAAGAGIAGAWLGAHIAAGESKADREAARLARFADRTRELAAQALESAHRYNLGVSTHMIVRRADARSTQRLNLGTTFHEVLRELRLICQQPVTLQAIEALDLAVVQVHDFQDESGAVGAAEEAEWASAEEAYERAVSAFTDAIRSELGTPSHPSPMA